ncbi:MAG: TetR/AcrR family transcriptional regulator [Gemmatimonadetes bacterium]|nr:TetR/AcrR family transcriptional regulator [Gemmatimonadota bacterium]
MKGRPREFDREEALEQAMDLFWSQGYEATGVADLCDRMGLGRQSLYNTYGDKESLFAEALEHYERVQLQPLVDVLEGPGSGVENVRRVLDMWERRGSEHGAQGCMMANSIAEFGMRAPRFSKQLTRMLGRIEKAFQTALERAAADGELPEGRDPHALARLFTTIGQGLSTVGKLDASGVMARDSTALARALLA